MSQALNFVAIGALGAFVLGKIKLKTALMVGVGSIILAQIIPSVTAGTSTTTS